MQPFIKGAALLAAMATVAVPVAASAAPVCLTKPEATSLITYALPEAINGTAKRCAASLPANSFLRTQGAQLASRYATQKQRYWTQARPAFLKVAGSRGADQASMMSNLPDETLRQLVDVFVEGMVSQQIGLQSCKRLDVAIDLLSPLPPENTAGLIALTLEVADAANPKLGKVALCQE